MVQDRSRLCVLLSNLWICCHPTRLSIFQWSSHTHTLCTHQVQTECIVCRKFIKIPKTESAFLHLFCLNWFASTCLTCLPWTQGWPVCFSIVEIDYLTYVHKKQLSIRIGITSTIIIFHYHYNYRHALIIVPCLKDVLQTVSISFKLFFCLKL